MKKIVSIIGARPQFIKAAAVSRAFSKSPIEEIIIHTGQHFDKNMSEIFFEEMQIPQPHYNLQINSLSHGAMTGRMIEEIEKVLQKENPDAVLIYGDTNSTIAGALAAKKLHIKVIHVEAGLRSFNMEMPEEINRILTDRISDFLFCPTETAVKNLMKEGFENFDCKIINSGDVMQDAALYYAQFSKDKSSITNDLNLQDKKFVLGTFHRQENTDNLENLSEIIRALNEINKSVPVIIPLHPRTKKIIQQNNLKPQFTIIEPVGYFDMIELLKNCQLVMTDSGGLQKEAFFFQKHCITMRDQTEWTELIENGFNVLTGADFTLITNAFHDFYTKESDFSIGLYGNGNASEIIISALETNL